MGTDDWDYGDGLRKISMWIPVKYLRDLLAMMMPETERGVSDYISLWRRLRYGCIADRRALLPLIGAEIDLRNIVWMYRLKEYYGVFGGVTYGRLIPIRYRLTEETMRKMADAKDCKALLAVVSQGPYAEVFPSFIKPERSLYHALAALYGKQARIHPDSLAPVCACLHTRLRSAIW